MCEVIPTGIDDRLLGALLEKQNGGQCKDAVLLGHFLVVDLHEIDASTVSLVVDVLDFGEHARTLLAIVADWPQKKYVKTTLTNRVGVTLFKNPQKNTAK